MSDLKNVTVNFDKAREDLQFEFNEWLAGKGYIRFSLKDINKQQFFVLISEWARVRMPGGKWISKDTLEFQNSILITNPLSLEDVIYWTEKVVKRAISIFAKDLKKGIKIPPSVLVDLGSNSKLVKVEFIDDAWEASKNGKSLARIVDGSWEVDITATEYAIDIGLL